MAVKSVQDWQNLNDLCRLLGYQVVEAKLKGNIGLGEHANHGGDKKYTHFYVIEGIA